MSFELFILLIFPNTLYEEKSFLRIIIFLSFDLFMLLIYMYLNNILFIIMFYLRYSTIHGGVRIGRLLEDMDVFAVHLGRITLL